MDGGNDLAGDDDINLEANDEWGDFCACVPVLPRGHFRTFAVENATWNVK